MDAAFKGMRRAISIIILPAAPHSNSPRTLPNRHHHRVYRFHDTWYGQHHSLTIDELGVPVMAMMSLDLHFGLKSLVALLGTFVKIFLPLADRNRGHILKPFGT